MSLPKRELFVAKDEFVSGDRATLRGKLLALQRDRLAGFYPATHSEKNQAVDLLDYAHKRRDHKIMTQVRLQEIFQASKREEVKKLQAAAHADDPEYQPQPIRYRDTDPALLAEAQEAGQMALRSLMVEWGDYLQNARQSHTGLHSLMEAVDDCPNPRAPLLDEVEADHPGIAPLVRFFDVTHIVQTGFDPDGAFDPLHTIEQRLDERDGFRGKFVYDHYSAPTRDPAVEAHIAETAERTMIGALRTLGVEAVHDQEHRAAFWEARLTEARSHLAARPAADLALASVAVTL